MENKKYKIPNWCTMSPEEHFDGVGGCWGIQYGHVEKEGVSYCNQCPFYKKGKTENDKTVQNI